MRNFILLLCYSPSCFLRNWNPFKSEISSLINKDICSTMICAEKITLTLKEKGSDGSLSTISANDVGNLDDFDNLRIGMQLSFMPKNETRGLKIEAVELITTKATSPKTAKVETFPFLSRKRFKHV